MKQLLLLFLCFFCLAFPASAQRWTYDHLSGTKIEMMAVSSGSKVFFYSGLTKIGNSQVLVEHVEIIDIHTGSKTVTPLATGIARTKGAAVALGNKVLFAGGTGSAGETTRVDLYDTLTATWSNALLSAKRYNLAGTATPTKAFFGGGFGNSTYSSVVDIYDSSTDSWTATQFPNATQPPQRTDLTAAAIGHRVLFSGGLTITNYRNLVSVYDANNNSWLTNTSLSQTKKDLGSIVYKNKAFFIGGTVKNNVTALLSPSDTIDIYDASTDSWTVLKIPRLMYHKNTKRAYTQAALAGCKLFLVPAQSSRGTTNPDPALDAFPDTIAIYDLARNTWSYEALPHPRSAVTVVAAQNKVYFAGGSNISYPENRMDDIDIYTVLPKLQLQVATVPVTDYAYDFGNVLTTDISHAQLNISNEGDYWLRFDEDPDKLSITGDLSDFTLDLTALQDVDTLEPAQSVQIPVSFHPQTTGEKTLTLQVSSDDPEHPLYSFVLKGNGTIANSTENSHLSQALSIYPVPCSDVLHIQLKTSFQEASLRLTDLSGKVILALKNIEADTAISTAGIPNGVYLLQILTDDHSYSSQVIVANL